MSGERMRALVSIPVLLVVAALAGCIGGSEPPAITPASPPPGAGPGLPSNPGNGTPMVNVSDAGPEVQAFPGHVAGVGAPGVGYVALQPLSENGFGFELRNGTTGFVVELVANGSSAMDLVLDVPAELCTDGDPAGLSGQCPDGPPPAEGAPPLKVMVVDPAMLYPGNWGGRVFAQQSPQATEYTVYVSVFYGAPPTEAYSAVVG
jgi:hypothetical protein